MNSLIRISLAAFIYVVLWSGNVLGQDQDYPPTLLLKEIMGMPLNPIPFSQRQVLRSCERILEPRKSEILQAQASCIQKGVPEYQRLDSVGKYRRQCDAVGSNCYLEMSKEIITSDCYGQELRNYSVAGAKFTTALMQFFCDQSVITLDYTVQDQSKTSPQQNNSRRASVYCYGDKERQSTENCVIEDYSRGGREYGFCDDLVSVSDCLEKHSFGNCSRTETQAFFRSALSQARKGACSNTTETESSETLGTTTEASGNQNGTVEDESEMHIQGHQNGTVENESETHIHNSHQNETTGRFQKKNVTLSSNAGTGFQFRTSVLSIPTIMVAKLYVQIV